jgi:flagellar protein FlaI
VTEPVKLTEKLTNIFMIDGAPLKPFIFFVEKEGQRRCIELDPPLTDEAKEIIETTRSHFLSKGTGLSNDLRELKSYVKKKKLLKNKNLNWNYLQYLVQRHLLGYGDIAGIMKNPDFEDISITPSGVVYVYHPDYGTLPTNVKADKDRLIQKLAWMTGKTPTFSTPVIRADLPGQGRINVILERVSRTGSSLHIRRRSRLLSLIDLLNNNTLPTEMASELWTLMTAKKAMIIIGAPSSGKTTLLNSLLFLLPYTTHVITVEDPPELRLLHEQWEQITSSIDLESTAAKPVTYENILAFILQSRPGYVVIGEIHGKEVELFTQLLNVPFLCSATFHSESPENMVERLTSRPMNMPRHLINHIDIVVKMGIRVREKIIRRVEGVYYQKDGDWIPRWQWNWREMTWSKTSEEFAPLDEALEFLELERDTINKQEEFLNSCPAGLKAKESFELIQSYLRK